MTTVLFYLVIAAVIGLVVFFLAVLVFGRGEQMAPLDPRTSPAELPDHDINSDDVRKIRFALALRGYRMSDVDWTLERLGEQIDSLRLENAQLREQVVLPGTERADELTVPDNPVSGGRSFTTPAATSDGPTTGAPATARPLSAGTAAAGPGTVEPKGALLTTSPPDSATTAAWTGSVNSSRPEYRTARTAEPAVDR